MKTQRSRKAENQGKAGRQRSRVEKLRIRNKNKKKRKKQTLKNIALHIMWQTHCYKPTTSMVFTTHLWIFRLIWWVVDHLDITGAATAKAAQGPGVDIEVPQSFPGSTEQRTGWAPGS